MTAQQAREAHARAERHLEKERIALAAADARLRTAAETPGGRELPDLRTARDAARAAVTAAEKNVETTAAELRTAELREQEAAAAEQERQREAAQERQREAARTKLAARLKKPLELLQAATEKATRTSALAQAGRLPRRPPTPARIVDAVLGLRASCDHTANAAQIAAAVAGEDLAAAVTAVEAIDPQHASIAPARTQAKLLAVFDLAADLADPRDLLHAARVLMSEALSRIEAAAKHRPGVDMVTLAAGLANLDASSPLVHVSGNDRIALWMATRTSEADALALVVNGLRPQPGPVPAAELELLTGRRLAAARAHGNPTLLPAELAAMQRDEDTARTSKRKKRRDERKALAEAPEDEDAPAPTTATGNP